MIVYQQNFSWGIFFCLFKCQLLQITMLKSKCKGRNSFVAESSSRKFCSPAKYMIFDPVLHTQALT